MPTYIPRGRLLSDAELESAFVDLEYIRFWLGRAVRTGDWSPYFNAIEDYRVNYYNQPTQGAQWDCRKITRKTS